MDSFLLVRISGSINTGIQPVFSRQIDFTDYRDVAGLKFPFTAIEKNDYGTSETRYERIIVNPPLPESIFQPGQ